MESDSGISVNLSHFDGGTARRAAGDAVTVAQVVNGEMKIFRNVLNAISGKSKMSLSCLFFVQDNCKPLLQNEHQPHLQHQWSQRRNPKD